jgi:hypothetical protein
MEIEDVFDPVEELRDFGRNARDIALGVLHAKWKDEEIDGVGET